MTFRVLIAVLLFCVLRYGDCRQPSPISKEHEYQIELEKRLQILNKPGVKTIVTNETGEIFDCVPINEQPAFSHPALKNHKIQLRPTIIPEFVKSQSKLGTTSVKLRGTREACPDGTVPIKRFTKEDLIRHDQELLAEIDENDNARKAVLSLQKNEKLMGSYLNMALYSLSIAGDQSSSSEVRFEAGPPNQTDVLSFGWKVSQRLNGDGFTRLFGYWHDGTNNKGCYDAYCPGFIQVDPEATLNYLFNLPLSTPGDPNKQYTVFLAVDQDPKNGNWWVYAGDDSTTIGYWPKELFPNLANGADSIAWGGVASPGANGDYPPMGSGSLPTGFYKDTSYFEGVRYLNSDHARIGLARGDTKINVDGAGCYGLDIVEPHEQLPITEFSFMFGGPGGRCV